MHDDLSPQARRLLASDSTDLGAELNRNRTALTTPQKSSGEASRIVTASEAQEFYTETVEDTRHALAVEAHNQTIAAHAADLIQNAELITDPSVLIAAHERLSAISPEAGALLLRNAHSLPDVAAELQAQQDAGRALAQIEHEDAVAHERGIAAYTKQLEEIQSASSRAGVDWVDTLGAVDVATEQGFEVSPSQAAEMARASVVDKNRRDQRADRFDSWFTPALTNRGQREELATAKEAYVNGDAPVEYRFEHASPDAVNAARLARQDEMKQALLGRVPTDLPSHEAWKTAGEAVAPRPKSAVDERDRQADAPSIY